MLPVNPLDAYHSPYASVSSLAGEPIYIDLEALVEDGLLDKSDLDWRPTGPLNSAAFTAALDFRELRWKKAFTRFHNGDGGETYREANADFLEENRSWVMPHAIYCTLAEQFETFQWSLWPDEKIRRGDPLVIEQFCVENEERIAYHIFLQLVFDVQWKKLRKYCKDRGVGLIGDVPIYVGAASADTWGNPELFQLDEFGQMERIAGVPGDSFNPDGQRWNSPLYRWEAHQKENYAWWLTRIRTCFRRFDAIRLDHFIGFYNYYSMPAEPSPDDQGMWVSGPAEDFFDAVLNEFPKTAFIAEDLGVMNAGVHKLRDKCGFPGMNVFQFHFDFRRNTDPTLEWKTNSVACTGTHDTTTLAAWFDELLEDRKKDEPYWDFDAIMSMLAPYMQGTDAWRERNSRIDPVISSRYEKITFPELSSVSVHEFADRSAALWGIIQKVMDSPGNTAIFPMQDLLGLDKKSRMNFPGHTEDNWIWRLDGRYLTETLAIAMKELSFCFGR